jgi:hypothetical protein
VALRDDEKPRLVRDLGQDLSAAAQPWPLDRRRVDTFEAVCTIQARALAGSAPIVAVDLRLIAGVREQAAAATRGLGAGLVWPGLVRRLDRQLPGYER